MSIQVLPPDTSRKGLHDRAPAKPLKFLHGDGSVTAPDPTMFGDELLPPDSSRAATYANAPAEPVKYLFPDGSVRDGQGLSEGIEGAGTGGVTMAQVNNAINAHNASGTAHADIRQAITNETARATTAEANLQTQVNTINASPFTFSQNTAAAVWTIPHNLGKQFVSVQLFDSAGVESETDIVYTSANIVTVIWPVPMVGRAIIRR